jgi:tight adherence protein B
MTGLSLSAATLASALVVLPNGSRNRLVSAGLAHRRKALIRNALSIEAGAVAAVVVVTVLTAVPVGLAALTVGFTVLMRHRNHKRQRQFVEQSRALETALEILVGELRAGAHPVAAFRVAATESEGTVATSFRAVAARALLGADVAEGLRGVGTSAARPAQWERLAICWELAQSHGLAIATLMRAAQLDIVERTRFGARVNAGMAGARATAAILAGLPLMGVGLGELIGAQPIRFLLGTGGWLLLAGVVLACGGLLWSDRIVARATP